MTFLEYPMMQQQRQYAARKLEVFYTKLTFRSGLMVTRLYLAFNQDPSFHSQSHTTEGADRSALENFRAVCYPFIPRPIALDHRAV